MYPSYLSILLDENLTIKEMADMLGISSSQVSYRKKKLREEGIDVPNKVNNYSDDEIRILCDLSIPTRECANMVGRSYDQVYRKRTKLLGKGFTAKLEVNDENKNTPITKSVPYSQEELDVVKDLSLTCRECAEKLGRSVYAIKAKRRRLRENES